VSPAPDVPPGTRLALLLLAALAADALFLHAVLGSGDQWGIWDWDYQCSLLEGARKTIVEYGQWPLWNPWLGGGPSMAGHPLGHTAGRRSCPCSSSARCPVSSWTCSSTC
jgi:hypothetical protein